MTTLARHSPNARRLLIAVALVTAAVPFAARGLGVSIRRFDPDELEHMHIAWYIANGHVPYRDFFEHHTPLFHYLVATIIPGLHPEQSSADGMHALFAVRGIAWLLSAGVIACTFVLARRVRDGACAWVAVAILANDITFGLRCAEIRPDGLSTLAWLSSLIALDAASLTPDAARPSARLLFAASGLCLGLGTLASQKLLLAGPSLVGLAFWYCSRSDLRGSFRQRSTNIGLQAAGTLLPWLGAMGWFASHGALRAFVDSTIVANLAWERETSAAILFAFLARYQPWLLGLAAGGACVLLFECFRTPERRSANVLVLVTAAGTFAGLFAIPTPHVQYCLIFDPLIAIMAAAFLLRATGFVAAAHDPTRNESIAIGAAAFLALVITVVCATPSSQAPFLRAFPDVNAYELPLRQGVACAAIIAAAVASVAVLPLYRRADLTIAMLLVAFAACPAHDTAGMLNMRAPDQFARLRYILSHSGPQSVVLDGWSGYGVFRRHAWFYWMLHPGVRAMLPSGAIDELLTALESGSIRPDIVIFDPHLRAVSDRVDAFIESHYRPGAFEDIYVLR